jgi:hypothetical protein
MLFCLSLLSAGIIGMCYCPQSCVYYLLQQGRTLVMRNFRLLRVRKSFYRILACARNWKALRKQDFGLYQMLLESRVIYDYLEK